VAHSESARTAPRRIRIRWIRVAGLVAVIVAVAAVLDFKSLVSSLKTVPLPSSPAARDEQRDALGEAGGAIADGATAFDDEVPGVANLDPALLRALRRAATAAAADGVDLVVNGGWRSPAYEDHLRREAIEKYGSAAEAARWVATGSTSPHVSGKAVDVGPADATPWLSGHGAAYGLCQIYANEPWHYELRRRAVAHGCPPMYADPTQDPRMRR
jgi:hypothetical protein